MLRVLVVLVVLARTADAEPEPVSYTGTLLLVDAAAFAAVIGGERIAEPIALGGIAAFVIAGPVVHTAYGNDDAIAPSVLLRVGLPLAGALAGRALNDGRDDVAFEVLGGLGGALIATAVDDVVLGHVMPAIVPTPNGTTIGISGAF